MNLSPEGIGIGGAIAPGPEGYPGHVTMAARSIDARYDGHAEFYDRLFAGAPSLTSPNRRLPRTTVSGGTHRCGSGGVRYPESSRSGV